MADSSRSGASAPLLAAVGASVALGLAVGLRGGSRAPDAPDAHLSSYLRDHLMGSDAALTMVRRLSRSHAGTAPGVLFAQLAGEFEMERDVVRSVLRQLGSSPISMKRAAGYASGVAFQSLAGGTSGSLAMFRTLESLLIGVQGKRCLWRALQALELHFDEAARFMTLEQQALDQWQRLETLRQDQVPLVFGVTA